MSYENPKNKITAVPAKDEEMWGATYKVTWFFIYTYIVSSLGFHEILVFDALILKYDFQKYLKLYI